MLRLHEASPTAVVVAPRMAVVPPMAVALKHRVLAPRGEDGQQTLMPTFITHVEDDEHGLDLIFSTRVRTWAVLLGLHQDIQPTAHPRNITLGLSLVD